MWDWSYTWAILPGLMRAFGFTIVLTLVSFAIAAILGLILTLLRRSAVPSVAASVTAAVEFIRGTPLLIQLYFLYFALPSLGLTFGPVEIGIFALSVHYAAYTSEIYRAGIETVPKGQWDAITALDLSRRDAWLRVLLPQVIPPIVPALSTYLILMFKDTPVLAAITVTEVLAQAEMLGSETFRYTEPLTIVGLLFLLVALISSLTVNKLERHVAYAR